MAPAKIVNHLALPVLDHPAPAPAVQTQNFCSKLPVLITALLDFSLTPTTELAKIVTQIVKIVSSHQQSAQVVPLPNSWFQKHVSLNALVALGRIQET